MIQDTIQRIETRLQGADHLPPERREELLALLATLKTEVAELATTDAVRAESLASHTEASARAVTGTEPDQQQLQHSIEGMAQAVQGFEASHPRLVHTVNAITNTLANLGI